MMRTILADTDNSSQSLEKLEPNVADANVRFNYTNTSAQHESYDE